MYVQLYVPTHTCGSQERSGVLLYPLFLLIPLRPSLTEPRDRVAARKLQQDQEVLGSMTKVLQCTSYSQPYPCALLGLSHFLHPGVQGSGVQRI